jgi:hypothetical protein
MKKLDLIIIVIKIWPNDSCLNCTPNVDIKDYMKANAILAKEND